MIKYPIKKEVNKKLVNYGNRGIDFENAINESNNFYLAHDIAVIYKKPTPIRVVEVNYPSRNKAMITKAFYVTPSTTDYNGIYKGYYIDFETKETNSKTAMSLKIVQQHQTEHLRNVSRHGAISFLLVYFKKLDEIYLLETKHLLVFDKRKNTGRKSISINEFREFGYLVKTGYNPQIDYLSIVDEIINKKS